MNRQDVVIELLEVLIHNILYLREIYPSQLFRKRKFLNLPVFQSIYPPLTSYLESIIKTGHELKDKLCGLDLVIYKNNDTVLEKYVFDLRKLQFKESDEYLTQFEDQARKTFYLLETRCKTFKKLPKNSKFKIFFHTTENTFLKLCTDSNFQDFLWIKKTDKKADIQEEASNLVPISDDLWFFVEL